MANEDIFFAGSQARTIYSFRYKTIEFIDSDLDFSKIKVPLPRHYLARTISSQ
jgi:hypothetical protein